MAMPVRSPCSARTDEPGLSRCQRACGPIWSACAAMLLPRTWWLLREGGKHLDHGRVCVIVRRAAEQAGIAAKVSPHWLRHAHASHALDHGAPIHLVQATLGHSSVATTSAYLHARPGDSSARFLSFGRNIAEPGRFNLLSPTTGVIHVSPANHAWQRRKHMATFTIDTENNITAHASVPANTEHQVFSSAKELAKLATDRPAPRLTEVWNSFAGVAPFDDLKPVKKFPNRKAAVTRQTNKRVAEQIESAHKTSLAKGEVGIRHRKAAATIRQFAVSDFLPFCRSTFVPKPKTLGYYENGTARLLEYSAVADESLDTITNEKIAGYARHRQDAGMKVSTVNRELQALRRMFALATEWGKVERVLPRVRMIPGEAHRDRVVSVNEEKLYFDATQSIGTAALEAYQCALVGIRATERSQMPIKPRDPYMLRDVAAILLDCGIRPEECFR